MNELRQTLIRTSLAFLGALGLAQGCVIDINGTDCTICDDSTLCHNRLVVDANGYEQCVCDSGYTRSYPGSDDLSCEPIESKGGESSCSASYHVLYDNSCYCIEGYNWCDPDDPNDLTCCVDDSQVDPDDYADCPNCGDPGCNNSIIVDEFGDEVCACDEGYDWADPSDDGDYLCIDSGGKGSDACTGPNNVIIGDECFCEAGYDFCTDDPDDLSCCEEEPKVGPPDDSECTEDGLYACSNDDPNDILGSILWECISGTWVETPGDEICQFDGTGDFAIGCVEIVEADQISIQTECAYGPGTACDLDGDYSCVDEDVAQLCLGGRVSELSCAEYCGDPDQLDETFAFGNCVEGSSFPCVCCDDPVDGVCP